MNTAFLVTFLVYLIFLMSVGIYFYFKTSNLEQYLLGGRGVGAWVTALSAQASDMSGWLLLGLPGAVYLFGVNQMWIAIGLIIGTFLNWHFIAPKLRIATEETQTITLPMFFQKKLHNSNGMIKNFSAIVILFFFTIYASSGLVAAGKLFESVFGLNYYTAVIIGMFTIVFYTFLGGYLASVWTDFFQGIIMFFAIIMVPVFAYNVVGGWQNLSEVLFEKNISRSLFDGVTLLGVISSLSWGLGYFGQPHILARFMSVSSLKELSKAQNIAMIWVIISLFGSVAIGLTGIGLFQNINQLRGDSELVFIMSVQQLFNPWLGGILLAAILSAIMSTIDSQLLVSSTTLTEDFYRLIRKDASEHELITAGRLSVILISLLALGLALNPQLKVFSLVSYAWAGFGAVFSPVVIALLYKPEIKAKSVFFGMSSGLIVLFLWKFLKYDSFLYELLPGFLANTLTMILSEFLFKSKQ